MICPAIAASDGKRRRIEDKQEPPPAYRQSSFDQFLQNMKEQAPKVGKVVFTEGPLLQQCAELFPGYHIVSIEACKGADRYRLPPSGVTKHSAPLRWSMGYHRNDTGTFSDSDWEAWSKITRRQAIRNCPPARLLVSIFARKQNENPSFPQISQKRKDNPSEQESVSKKHCRSEEHSPNDRIPETGPSSENKILCQSHGPLFSSLPPEIRTQIMKLHKNLGHPDNRLMSKVLRDQQWDPEVVEKISDMVCPSCFENQKPRLARPAHLTTEREFNDLFDDRWGRMDQSRGPQAYVLPHD